MLTTFAIIVAASSFSAGHASAEPYWPWCARYDPWTIVCSFATRAQCDATVSGAGGYCQENVRPPPAEAARVMYRQKPRTQHRRRHHHR
jgi:hypothetical protein